MIAKTSHNVKTFWQGSVSALRFLTIFPWGPDQAFDARKALPYFPFCGLFIGAIIVAVDMMATFFWPRPVVALIDLMALALISGALHLDGVADTADGLYGQRKPDHAMAIMKDSRIGAMGLVAVLLCVTTKWAGLSAMDASSKIWLLLVPAYARASVLIAIKCLPYGRPDGGTGQAFFDKPLAPADFLGFLPLLMISSLMGGDALILNIGFVVITAIVLLWYKRKLRVITGDMLGALIEFNEAALFVLAAARWMG